MPSSIEFWKREGFYYIARIHVSNRHCQGTITKTLDFFTYHLIKLVHGEKGLREMATKYTPSGD